MEDKEIIGLFLERNSSAIEESRRKYGAALERTAKNILSDPQDSEECVNDAYLAAWNAIPPERPVSLGAVARGLSHRPDEKYQRFKASGAGCTEEGRRGICRGFR